LQIAKQQHKLRQKDLEKQLIRICQAYLTERCDGFQDQKELFETFQLKLISLQANLEVGLRLVLKFWQHFGRHIKGGEYVELCGKLLDWLLPPQPGAARQDEFGGHSTSTTNCPAAHVSQLQCDVDHSLGIVTSTQWGAIHSHSADQLTASTQRMHGHTPARRCRILPKGCASAQQEDSMYSQQTRLCSNSAPRAPPAQGVQNLDGLLDQSDSAEPVMKAGFSLLDLSSLPIGPANADNCQNQHFRGSSQSHQVCQLQHISCTQCSQCATVISLCNMHSVCVVLLSSQNNNALLALGIIAAKLLAHQQFCSACTKASCMQEAMASVQSPALCCNLESIHSGQVSMLGHSQSHMHDQAVQQQHAFPVNQSGSMQASLHASLPAELLACRQPAGLGAGTLLNLLSSQSACCFCEIALIGQYMCCHIKLRRCNSFLLEEQSVRLNAVGAVHLHVSCTRHMRIDDANAHI